MRRGSPTHPILLPLENIRWLVSFIPRQNICVVVSKIRLLQIWVLLWFRVSIFIGPRYPWGPIYESGPMSLTTTPYADLTDVTLADEDGSSEPADYVNRAILGNVAMQVAPPGGQN